MKKCCASLVFTLAAGLVSGATQTAIELRTLDHVHRAARDGLTPTDFHHLVFGFTWRSTLPDWGLARRGLERLQNLKRVHPLMADELRLLQAELAMDEGRPDEARQLFAAMGGLSRWWVLGPSGIDELEDFPDRAVLPAADARWRPAFGTDPMGWVHLGGVAWPARRQMVYLSTTLTSAGEQAVAIRLGVAQCARVWLNGVEVMTTPRPLAHAEDQVNAGAWLQAGSNGLVVAVASESDDWWLRLRLTAPSGEPLIGVRELAGEPSIGQPSSRPAPSVESLEEEIRAAAERDREGAKTALAAYLMARRPQPVGAGDARVACRAARTESPAEARLLEWLITSEPTTARALLEEALAEDPMLHWVRVELAKWYHEKGLYDEADRLTADAAEEPFVHAAALDMDAIRWGPLVIPGLTDLFATFPRSANVGVILANRAIDGHHWQLAQRTAAELASFAPGLVKVETLQHELAEGCGDGHTLAALLHRRLDLDPNRPVVRIRLSRLLVAEGELDSAREILGAGLARCPDHTDLMIELARLDHTQGRDEEAAALARKMLELRPQDRRAQLLLELLGDDRHEEEWRRPQEELWAMAEGATKELPTVALIDHVELRFLPSNLTEERVQRAYLVNQAERADHLLTHPLAYIPERHRLRILAARILRSDGSEVSARQSDTPRLSEPEINIYYDTRLRVLRFADLEDGDLIEIAYELTETVEANETGPYRGGILRLGERMPLLLAEVEMSGPGEILPSWELAHLEGEPERLEDADGVTRLRWRWTDLPAQPHDSPPSPDLLVTPHLSYSNHASWADLAQWYSKHVAPRVRPSRLVEQTANELTDGVSDRLNRIVRLYRFVTDEIRYVGLEFGEHRFRPFPADWVLNHRIGDCKDKAALLVSLLGAVGVPAEMVMIRTSDLGPVATSVAVLEVFNHAIVYLPEDDLWLDGTASGHDPYPPPTIDQGAWVMAVRGQQSSPETTPIPGAGVARYSYTLQRTEDGRIHLMIRTEDTGEAADSRRALFSGTNDPRRYAAWLQSQFPGADLVGEPKVSLRPGTTPATMELEATVARSAVLSRGGIPAYPGDFDWASKLVPSATRSGPLLLPVTYDLEWSLEVDLGHPPRDLPESTELDTAFGSLRLTVQSSGLGYRVEGYFHLEPGLIQADDAPALRDFLVTVQRTLETTLEAP